MRLGEPFMRVVVALACIATLDDVGGRSSAENERKRQCEHGGFVPRHEQRNAGGDVGGDAAQHKQGMNGKFVASTSLAYFSSEVQHTDKLYTMV